MGALETVQGDFTTTTIFQLPTRLTYDHFYLIIYFGNYRQSILDHIPRDGHRYRTSHAGDHLSQVLLLTQELRFQVWDLAMSASDSNAILSTAWSRPITEFRCRDNRSFYLPPWSTDEPAADEPLFQRWLDDVDGAHPGEKWRQPTLPFWSCLGSTPTGVRCVPVATVVAAAFTLHNDLRHIRVNDGLFPSSHPFCFICHLLLIALPPTSVLQYHSMRTCVHVGTTISFSVSPIYQKLMIKFLASPHRSFVCATDKNGMVHTAFVI